MGHHHGGADWHINPKDIRPGDELGRGSFGVVRRASWRHTPVAIKILYTDAQAEDQALFEAEVAMMATLHHPNIVQFLGYTKTPSLTLVIELFPEGSLEDFVLKKKSCAKTSLRFCFEMALAIEYLHSRSPSIVIHRDIKPANFLLTASRRVKLGDFGIARTRRHAQEFLYQPIESSPRPGDDDEGKKTNSSSSSSPRNNVQASSTSSGLCRQGALPSTEDLTSNCGTVRFMAPEVASPDGKKGTTKYSTNADIFSLALVYYFVWERVLPAIPNHNTPTSHFTALHEGKRPPLSKTPSFFRDLIKRMWQFEPNDRPSASELLDDLALIQHHHSSSSSSGANSSATPRSFLGGFFG